MKRRTWYFAGAVGALALAGGLAVFEPWRAFTSSTIDEAVPTSLSSQPVLETADPAPENPPRVEPAPRETASPTPVPQPSPTQEVLSTGKFVDAEHDTSGTAKILALADGRRYLRIEGLDTSDGPDLHVWLSEATAGGSWGKYDDDGYVKLGKLKATNGNQNYLIPAGADIATMRSAVIWCDRFNVAFGAAPLAA